MPTTAVTDSWLRSLISYDFAPEALASRLVAHGIEVDEIRDTVSPLTAFVAAKVLSVEPHENADRLSVCSVLAFGDAEPTQVVCGAPNVAAGQIVAFAPVGSTMPDGSFTIEKRKLRGVVSEGMICSEAELGIGDDTSGILVLDSETPVGTTLGEIFGEIVYELDITPNRGDCLGHLGIAREIRTMNGHEIRRPDIPASDARSDADWLSVRIEDTVGCPRYAARLVRGVKIGPSPVWLTRRLRAIGVRPINNVVDAATWVMFESGHPLHAFDYRAIDQQTIVVRKSLPGESIVTLDGESRKLPADTVMIADPNRGIAIGGVMGGENSEITAGTTDVLIESAMFDASRIRAAARQVNLATDASYRFERGADAEVLLDALDRAADLIVEVAGGEPEPEHVDVVGAPFEPRCLAYPPRLSDRILGITIPESRQIEILSRLGFVVNVEDVDSWSITVPSWRTDVTGAIDLVEEIGRVFGYENVPERLSDSGFALARPTRLQQIVRETRIHCVAVGFSEVVLPYQTSPERVEPYVDRSAIALRNALGRDTSVMRSTLLPGLADVVETNLRHGRSDLRLFEIGKVFRRSSDDRGTIPSIVETEELGMVFAGRAEAARWDDHTTTVDLSEVQGILRRYLQRLRLPEPTFEPVDGARWGFGQTSIDILVDDRHVGRIGPFASELVSESSAQQNLAVVIDMVRLSEIPVRTRQYSQPVRFPAMIRDLSLLLPVDRSNAEVVVAVRAVSGDVLEVAFPFDLYFGDSLPDGMKSVSYRLRFRSPDGTLTDADVDPIIERIVAAIGKIGGELRG